MNAREGGGCAHEWQEGLVLRAEPNESGRQRMEAAYNAWDVMHMVVWDREVEFECCLCGERKVEWVRG